MHRVWICGCQCSYKSAECVPWERQFSLTLAVTSSRRSSLHFIACFHLTAPKLILPSVCVCVCVLPRQCQEVRYDCIIRYRPQPQPSSIAWYWFLKPVQQAWNCPHSEFRRRSAFICQENICALLSHVSCGSLNVCLLVLCWWLTFRFP